ncbi:diguanylate cyclase domain-containing protein [Aquisalimonas asiatica]|uniref:PAS domain S-box-containing protein/diguanylate cyclase (GGDEF) domain-containing protein n=1 Tax=Aquisalimonas asiatica TaxID=406100 RepID=A0A1H8V6S4_9GAMM|nr:diguanylate cyclase [Aquisalimonas asiatica]SEP11162.1 PAS domain S-box-containing protein/diguanylate cyclase (GGDEF) domain-containing protein [Aquisalimonas asiatica]
MGKPAQARLPAGVAERILDYTSEAVLVADANREICWVNRAFTTITGYTLDDVRGRQPTLFRSDHHDDAFYQAIYEKLMTTGSWCGEIWRRRKDGDVFPALLTVTRIVGDTPDDTFYVDFFTDMAAYKQHEQRVEFLVHHDVLTELPNRFLLMDRLAGALARARRKDNALAVLFVDIDNFKALNDRHGHAVGDAVLRAAAHRFLWCVREGDTVARLGGDEFVILLEELGSPDDAATIGESIRAAFAAPVHHNGVDLEMTISIGISHYPSDATEPDALIDRADASMYRAKRAGRNRVDRIIAGPYSR